MATLEAVAEGIAVMVEPSPNDNNVQFGVRQQQRLRKSISKRFSIKMSTEQANQTDEKKFYGPYQHLKKNMDYNYHSYYRMERQWLHDSIIEDYLCHEEQAKNCVPAVPWLLYTCGVKGSGKRFLIDKLMEDGRLPLLSTIIVDPDEIKRSLPEFSSYAAGEDFELVAQQMNKEAGYISELLISAALQAGSNVLIDGQLLTVDWRLNQFQKLRNSYPKLRIALIHVTAPLDVIQKRIELRAEETGYHIPPEYTKRLMEEMPTNVKAVKPSVDVFFKIENAGEKDFRLLEGAETWQQFTKTFQQEVEVVRDGGCKKEICVEQAIRSLNDIDEEKEESNLNRRIPSSNDVDEEKQKTNLLRRRSMETPRPLALTRRVASLQETRYAAKSFRLRRRSHRKPFRVDKSTEDNHASNDMQFYGKYSHIRETLDYSYHKNYTYERQKFQDAIITEFLHGAVITDKDGQLCTTPTEPWLVFTAGPMGAGKSFTIRRLVEEGRFPLIAFISVDPDQIRRQLPEYNVYLDVNPESAGDLTHKEAGFISEILTLAGLQSGKNVMVDGSLRNAEWYKTYFQRLRSDFPILRLAIIHVTAPREAIFQRAKERAAFTGRVVPTSLLEKAIEQVPKSVKILAPLVDYFVELENAPGAADIKLCNEGETWENFASKWVQYVLSMLRSML